MKISRRGSSANHGTNSVELRKISVSWDANEDAIVIKSNNIRDFNTDSSHNYDITIPLCDIAKIISVIGHKGVSLSATGIESGLEDEIKALHRLIAAASGLVKSNEEA